MPTAATGSSAGGKKALAPVGSDEFDRGISFFDAIYGFAITLLIANVDSPPPEAWRSVRALLDSGAATQLTGFALSFTVIAIFWRLNVRVTRALGGLDGPTTLLNLVAAAMIVVIPFTTQGISDPETAGLALPTALYALNIAAASLSQTAVHQLGRARGMERVPSTRGDNARLLADALVTPAVFLASVPVALVAGGTQAKWVWASLFVLAPLSGKLLRRNER